MLSWHLCPILLLLRGVLLLLGILRLRLNVLLRRVLLLLLLGRVLLGGVLLRLLSVLGGVLLPLLLVRSILVLHVGQYRYLRGRVGMYTVLVLNCM